MKTQKSLRQLAKRYVSAIQNEIDLSHNEFSSEPTNDEINISVKNGYWQINNKPLTRCSIAKQTLFDQYMRMKFVKSPVTEESSFKKRASEVKQKFNHVFKMREQNIFENYPNIGNLEFIKATNPNLFKTKTA